MKFRTGDNASTLSLLTVAKQNPHAPLFPLLKNYYKIADSGLIRYVIFFIGRLLAGSLKVL